jgi:signal transduction histidine kinase/ActR/RegA family two-component response regulator
VAAGGVVGAARTRMLVLICTKTPWLTVPLSVITLVLGDTIGPGVFALLSVVMLGVGHRVKQDSAWAEKGAWILGSVVVLAYLALLGVGGGGILAPAMYVFPLIPPFISFMLGIRVGLGATGIGFLPILYFLFYGDPPWTLPVNGTELDVLYVLGPIASAMLMTLVALAFEDSSDAQEVRIRDAAAAAARSSRAKSAFLATMSHELRTPLGVVVGIGQLLQQKSPNMGAEKGSVISTTNRRIQLLVGSGASLLHLVDDILDLARLEAGKVEVDLQPVDLSRMVEEARAGMVERITRKGLHLHVLREGPELVVSDPLRLRQILEKLLDNAVKFTDRGEVWVRVRVSTLERISGEERRVLSDDLAWAGRDSCTHCLELSVEDTGVGIPSAGREAIFESFVQIEQGLDRRHGGGGLGLSIVAHLVERLGGELSLDSAVGAGTEVRVRVPVGLPEPSEVAVDGQKSDGPVRVLVAEDNVVNQLVITAQLEAQGCVVVCVADGEAAVEAALSGSYAFILMDEQMPGMGGLQATRALRERGYRSPIVAFTANTDEGAAANARAAGMDGVLVKPARPGDLASLLRRLVPWAVCEEPHR